MTVAIERWNSHPVNERALPAGLVWQTEPPNPDHMVRLAFAKDPRGHTYRRVTFRDGSRIFSELEFVTGVAQRG